MDQVRKRDLKLRTIPWTDDFATTFEEEVNAWLTSLDENPEAVVVDVEYATTIVKAGNSFTGVIVAYILYTE